MSIYSINILSVGLSFGLQKMYIYWSVNLSAAFLDTGPILFFYEDTPDFGASLLQMFCP